MNLLPILIGFTAAVFAFFLLGLYKHVLERLEK